MPPAYLISKVKKIAITYLWKQRKTWYMMCICLIKQWVNVITQESTMHAWVLRNKSVCDSKLLI